MKTLVKSIMLNHGLEVPYLPKWYEHRLYRVSQPINGKRYYTEYWGLPTVQTWLSDEEAEAVMKNWDKQLAQMITK